MATPLRILRKPVVLERRGCSNSTLYDDIKRGLYPQPVALGPNSSGWPEHEVDLMIAARMAGKPEAEIRALVVRLHEQRRELFRELAGAA